MNVRERWWWLRETSAVAAKLRQLLPRIVAEFVKWDPEVTAIRVEVQVSAERPTGATCSPCALTPQALGELCPIARRASRIAPARGRSRRLVEHGARSNGDDQALEHDERQDDQGQDH